MNAKSIASEETRALENVLKVLETMFFSMPIPEDIVSKYNFLKEKNLKRVGLEFAPITRLQFPLIGSSQKPTASISESNKLIELEESYISLYEDNFSLYESIISLFIDRSGDLIEIIKDPFKGAYCNNTRIISF